LTVACFFHRFFDQIKTWDNDYL